ncbi:MAG: ABC transporter substrate-binding protein [Actinomycetota bacterium]
MEGNVRTRTRLIRLLALLFAFALVAAACGDSDSDDGGGDDSSEAEAAETTDETEAPADDGDDADTTDAPADDGGDGSGEAMVADGEPIVIGLQNPEGDPAGSFPEYSQAIQAAAEYINAELGGLGGRPIEISLCTIAITPDDSQRCANELAAEGVELAISTLNFFGNHFPIYQGSDIPVIVGSPITIADFTSPGVYSIGAGGGCLGVHTGLVQFATQNIAEITGEPVTKVAVPWADTPPGVVCYADLEQKPLDVLAGSEPGTSELAGSMPDLEHIGVPILPASADVTPQATEVLDFEPDVIIFSAQGADCWTFVDALGRLGWTPDQIPLVLSGACTDFEAQAAAGELANGIYLTGTQNSLLSPPESLGPGQHLDNVTVYREKAPEYGLDESLLFTGFAGQGFSAMMAIYEIAATIDGDVTGQAISDAFAATDGTQPSFGNAPLDCAGAPAPYVAVCSSLISVSQWDGTQLNNVAEVVNGLGLVAGTELRPTPN